MNLPLRLLRIPIILLSIAALSAGDSLFAEDPSTPRSAVQTPAGLTGESKSALQPASATIWRKDGDQSRLHVTAWLSADRFAPGTSCELLLELQIQDGWHLHAAYIDEKHSGPFRTGWPYTRLDFRGPNGWTVETILYPAGTPLPQFEQLDLPPAYRDRVRIRATITAPEEPAIARPDLEFEIVYQATNDHLCELPTSIRVSIPITVAASAEDVQAINADLFGNPSPEDSK